MPGFNSGGPFGILVLPASLPQCQADGVDRDWGHPDRAACPRRAGASRKQEGSLVARIPWDGGPPFPGMATKVSRPDPGASNARPWEHEGVPPNQPARMKSPSRFLSGKPRQ